MGISPQEQFEKLQATSCMNFGNEELKYLDDLDGSVQTLKNIGNDTMNDNNFYMTQPLSPLECKLSQEMLATYI